MIVLTSSSIAAQWVAPTYGLSFANEDLTRRGNLLPVGLIMTIEMRRIVPFIT